MLALGLRGGPFGESPAGPVAEAAQKTRSVAGARIAGTGEAIGGGLAMTMRFRGAYSGETGRSIIRMHARVPHAPQLAAMMNPFVAVQEGMVTYISSPAFRGALPFGKDWLKIDASSLAGESASAAGEVNSLDAREILAGLEEVSDSARRVGAERVRGARTIRYAASIDPAREAERLREAGAEEIAEAIERQGAPTTVDVWVGRAGLVRRISTTVPFALAGGPGARISMTMDFFGFGAEPKIEIPPPIATYDATELGKRALEEALGRS